MSSIDTDMSYNRQTYIEHLQSDYWREVRRAVWRRDQGRCQFCNSKGHHCHHRSYRWFGHELDNLDSVLLLCRDCHDACHLKPSPSWAELLRRIQKL